MFRMDLAMISGLVPGTSFAPAMNPMNWKPYLDCLGCGVVLRGYKGSSPQTLCIDCRRFAAFATHGTRCPKCNSTTVLSCTERDGFETLFCTACDRVWSRDSSSVDVTRAEASSSTHARWVGAERRLLLKAG